MDQPVIESAEFIASVSQHVKLGNDDDYQATSKILEPYIKNFQKESWADFPLHPFELKDQEKKASWVFLIDTMNYAFWTPENQVPFTVSYKNKNYTGYWSLCAAIKKEIEKSDQILNPYFWANSTIEDWQRIFKSETETSIPFIEWRQQTISEAGKFLIEKYNGSVLNMIIDSNRSSLKLVDILINNLNSYKDMCEFEGRTVYFLKRAQIFAADLHYAFSLDSNSEYCQFLDIDKLTMFADYRVPQVLNYFNLIRYDDYLYGELKTNPHFECGSRLECEIRGCSILSVEKLKKFISIPSINSITIDFVLWTFAKEHSDLMDYIPIHKTRGIFY